MWLQKWIDDCNSETLAKKVATFCATSGQLAVLDDADCRCTAHKALRADVFEEEAITSREAAIAARKAEEAAQKTSEATQLDLDAAIEDRNQAQKAAFVSAEFASKYLSQCDEAKKEAAEFKQEAATWQGRAEVAEKELASVSATLQGFRETLSELL